MGLGLGTSRGKGKKDGNLEVGFQALASNYKVDGLGAVGLGGVPSSRHSTLKHLKGIVSSNLQSMHAE